MCVGEGGGDTECCFTSTATVGLLGTGAQDGHLDSHIAPEFGGRMGGGGRWLKTINEFKKRLW